MREYTSSHNSEDTNIKITFDNKVMITINRDAKVTLHDENYTFDDAAKFFWELIEKYGGPFIDRQKRKGFQAAIGALSGIEAAHAEDPVEWLEENRDKILKGIL